MMPFFIKTPFQEDKLLGREKNLNSASNVANWIIVETLKYLFY